MPVEPILYNHPESPDVEHEYVVVDAGALDQQTAEYIVRLHNNKIEQNKIVSDGMVKILQEKPLDKDCGISQ